MVSRVSVKPELLRWARERSGLPLAELEAKFGKLPEWESGDTKPTLRQVEKFASTVHVPVGYLFLDKPPEEEMPIPDFRTLPGRTVTRPGPDLLDTIYICQERQGWYRDFALAADEKKLEFVGSVTVRMSPRVVAARIREELDIDITAFQQCNTWAKALQLLISKVDEAGVLVMVSGVVKSNNHRRLDPDEFRGFALSDPFAPLVFVNGADTRAAQIFTLAHELAHIWLGESALSDIGEKPSPDCHGDEAWCNAVAAEFLVPLAEFRTELRQEEPLQEALPRLAKIFKVSTLVILRRMLDADIIDRTSFDAAWEQEVKRLAALARDENKGGGGNFYLTTLARAGRRFTSALVESTLEGHTLYRDAFRMLGISSVATFNKLGHEAGIISDQLPA